MEDLKLWTVTYTKHNTQKRKVYQDGFLELHTSSNKAKLYDDCNMLLDCRILKRCEVVRDGETIALNVYLVDIVEPSRARKPLSGLKSRENDAKFTQTLGGRKDNSIKKKVGLTLSPSQKIIRGNFQINVVQRQNSSKFCFYRGDEMESSRENKPLRDSLEILSTLQKPRPCVRIPARETKETITTTPSSSNEPESTDFS